VSWGNIRECKREWLYGVPGEAGSQSQGPQTQVVESGDIRAIAVEAWP